MKKKILLWFLYAIIIFGAVYAPAIPLPFFEACLALGLLILLHICYEKHVYNKELMQTLCRKNELLEDIFKYTPDLIFVKDKHLRYSSANQSLISNHGGIKENVIGKTDKDLMPKNSDEIFQFDSAVLRTGKCIKYEQELEFFDGATRVFQIVKSPLRDNKNEIVGVLGISRDITELKEIELQKDNFVETLTHDLKAPTTAQIKALELVLNNGFGELKVEQREILNCTLSSCKYMLSMILNILSTYKYDKGIKNLVFTQLEFKDLLDECISELKYLSEDNKLTLKIDCCDNLPKINADWIELKRVVVNLISNAFFYAMSNTEVKISAEVIDKNFVFKVSTESNPLTRDEVENLFKKFFTGVSKFRPVGTGLGLYLSKQIITKHGGNMIYESDEDAGNTFGFELPID